MEQKQNTVTPESGEQIQSNLHGVYLSEHTAENEQYPATQKADGAKPFVPATESLKRRAVICGPEVTLLSQILVAYQNVDAEMFNFLCDHWGDVQGEDIYNEQFHPLMEKVRQYIENTLGRMVGENICYSANITETTITI